MQNFNALKPKGSKTDIDYSGLLLTQTHDSLEVTGIRHLTDTAYVLRVERKNLKLKAGQHISLGVGENGSTREYSIYSGENEQFIEVLIKEVEEGLISRQLKKCKIGDRVKFDGPVGYFLIDEEPRKSDKFLFIASGTGIAPFHSFIRSYPELDFKLLHGVRYGSEAYEKSEYDPGRFVLCTSRDEEGDFNGRVTDFLKENPVDPNTQVYLCGNCEMIHDAYDILLDQGIPADNLHSEVYF